MNTKNTKKNRISVLSYLLLLSPVAILFAMGKFVEFHEENSIPLEVTYVSNDGLWTSTEKTASRFMFDEVIWSFAKHKLSCNPEAVLLRQTNIRNSGEHPRELILPADKSLFQTLNKCSRDRSVTIEHIAWAPLKNDSFNPKEAVQCIKIGTDHCARTLITVPIYKY